MTEVIGIKFRSVGKIYYFDPKGEIIQEGVNVIVETTRGVECGEVVISNRLVEDSEVILPLKHVMRIANENDAKIIEENKIKEKEAYGICINKINERKLKMNLIDVNYTFDRNKILFYFTADGRVDFRELVKDLASIFRTRIELRQIGVRDQSKMLGGLGVCGREFCCSSFLGDFQPVSIKMAKEQGLSLNPVKISGTCGRLMCCLKYEQDVYEELLRTSPKIGAYVTTPEGRGYVIDCNLLTGIYRVKMDSAPDALPKTFNKKEIKIIRDAEIKLEKEELKALKELEE